MRRCRTPRRSPRRRGSRGRCSRCSTRLCGSGSCRRPRARRPALSLSSRGRDLMPYWPPDTPPSVPEQMPQATSPGPAPVPYGAPGMAIAPDMLAPSPHVPQSLSDAAGVLIGGTGANHVTEAPLRAPNVNPYDPASPQSIFVGADAGAGGRDVGSGTVAGSVTTAHAWLGEVQGDGYGQGSRIGDLMSLPGTTAGGESGGGAFYGPPRDYGGQ